MFDWCSSGEHSQCVREYKIFYIDNKTNKPVYTGEVRKCQCKKRGCKCYVNPADRPKKTAKRRSKK